MCSLGNLCGSLCGALNLKACENVCHCDNCYVFGRRSSNSGDNSDQADEQREIPMSRQLDINAVGKAIKKSLKKTYEKIKLPSLPWLEDVDVSIINYTKLALEVKSVHGDVTRKSIELDNLFDAVDKKKPKRISIESQPGYGKTTLAHKIISDWVKEEKYVRRFKFAILIILRDLQKDTLRSEVENLISVKNCSANVAWDVVNTEETLLVLDGLDEVSNETRKNLVEILYDAKNVNNMTIVTTSRIGSSNVTKEEIQSVFKGVSVQTDFWCKKIMILGINDENREEFLDNFVDDVDKDNTMKRLQEIIEDRKEMFKSPLLLILLVYVMSENHDVKIKTDTDIYKSLVDCMVRRSVSKTNPGIVKENCSVFDPSLNDSSVFHKSKILLYKLGKISIDNILKDKLHFDANGDTKAIHHVGFLLKHETRRKLKLVVHYEGFHLSFLEFAAAFYFWENLRRDEYKFSADLFKKFKKTCLERKSSLILPFLSGLAGNEISCLLGLFSCYRFSRWFNVNVINAVLSECSENFANNEHISEFIPVYFESYNSESLANFKNLISRYSLSSKLSFNLSDLSKRMRPFSAKFLSILVEDKDIEEGNEFNAENIQCDVLSLEIQLTKVVTYDVVAQLLTSFFKISSGKKKIFIHQLNSDNFIDFEKCIDNGILRDKDLDFIFVVFHESVGVDVITRIVENNRVERVELVFRSHIELNSATDIIYKVAKSNSTSSLSVVDRTNDRALRLDLDAITQNGAKKWEVLRFYNVEVESKMSLNGNSRVASLVIYNTTNYENLLFSVVPIRLECGSDVLKSLLVNERLRGWEGWHSVVELKFKIIPPKEKNSENSFSYCSKFKCLEKLTVEIIDNDVEPNVCSNFIHSLNLSDKLNQLIIRLDLSQAHGPNLDKYIPNIINSIMRKKWKFLKNIIVELLVSDINKENYDIVTSYMRANSKEVFRFLFRDYYWISRFAQDNIFDLQNFNVEYSLLTCFDTRYFNHTNIHQLQLTLK